METKGLRSLVDGLRARIRSPQEIAEIFDYLTLAMDDRGDSKTCYRGVKGLICDETKASMRRLTE